MRTYYIIENNTNKSGPYTFDQVKKKNLPMDTPIWYDGLKDWTILANLSETGEVISVTLPPKYINHEAKQTQTTSPPSSKKLITIIALVGLAVVGYFLVSKFQISREFTPLMNLYKEKDSLDINGLQKLYDKEYGKATYLLGKYYFRKGDTATAAKYYSDAIKHGEKLLGNLGLALLKQRQERKKWFSENIDELKQEASSSGNWYIQTLLGKIYYNGDILEKDLNMSFTYFKKAAENNAAFAQYMLGAFYMNGLGIKVDEKEAFKWYRRSAENGNTDAQNAMGYLYQEGKGTTKNVTEAFKWYKLSAESGNPSGQTSLGICYMKGIGVEKDLKESIKWYQLAADKGDTTAQLQLGWSYFGGNLGVKKDLKLATKWFKKAEENGSVDAKTGLRLTALFGDLYKMFSSPSNTYYPSNQNSSSNSYVANCKWCGRSFRGEWGYGDIYGRPADYCSPKCKREATGW
jgi:TPR repeat protein